MRWMPEAPTGRTLTSRQELAQLGDDECWVVVDVVVGVAAELVAAGAGLALTPAVLLPGVAGVVVGVAVELDGQAVFGPAAVDVAPARGPVGLGQRQPCRSQQGEEGALELAERDAGLAPEDLVEHAGA